MAIISPSLEAANLMTATHTTFYASPEFKGLGMKLQRASIDSLKAKGVDEAYFYAGVRGSGPRIGTLYKRLGATNYGEFYKLTLR